MTPPSALGDYLRARREVVTPVEVGLPEGARRRVAGLRREEVALLAGISPEYYLRLEQGRDLHPSDQVLDSLAAALLLDDEAALYLREVAHPAPARRRRPRAERVSPHIETLIAGWPLTAAYVQGRSAVVLASNHLARALSPWFASGESPLRALFLKPEMREFYRDWDAATAKAVPFLRSIVGAELDDPRVTELVGELSLRSERFRTLWARHDVRLRGTGSTLLRHPQVGDLDLHYEKLVLSDSDQILVTYHADPGSESEQSLRLLASLG